MPKAKLSPTVRAEIMESLQDLEELDSQLDALDELGQLMPGQREVHTEAKRRAKVLLDNF